MANQLTYLEVLEDTVKYYSEDVNRRGLNLNGGCVYHGIKDDNTVLCAVGRCLKDPKEFESNRWGSVSDFYCDIFNDDFIPALKEEYQHLTYRRFWEFLQMLHDTELFWDANGITKAGENQVEVIKADLKSANLC